MLNYPGKEFLHYVYLRSHLSLSQPEFVNQGYKQLSTSQVVFHPGYLNEKKQNRIDYDIGNAIKFFQFLQNANKLCCTYYVNLALLILSEPIQLGVDTPEYLRIDPICLPKKGYVDSIKGLNATAAGWGSIFPHPTGVDIHTYKHLLIFLENQDPILKNCSVCTA